MKFKGIEIELNEMYEFTKKIVDEVLESELITEEKDVEIFIQGLESNLKLTFNALRKKGVSYGQYIKMQQNKGDNEVEEIERPPFVAGWLDAKAFKEHKERVERIEEMKEEIISTLNEEEIKKDVKMENKEREIGFIIADNNIIDGNEILKILRDNERNVYSILIEACMRCYKEEAELTNDELRKEEYLKKSQMLEKESIEAEKRYWENLGKKRKKN